MTKVMNEHVKTYFFLIQGIVLLQIHFNQPCTPFIVDAFILFLYYTSFHTFHIGTDSLHIYVKSIKHFYFLPSFFQLTQFHYAKFK